MKNYRETSQESTSWRRVVEVRINNPLNAPATVHYVEHDMLRLPDRAIVTGADSMTLNYTPGSQIELRDPKTLERTGKMISEDLVQLAIYSKYLNGAEARDKWLEELAANVPTHGMPIPAYIEPPIDASTPDTEKKKA